MQISNKISIQKILISALIFIVVFSIIVARRPDIIMYAQPWAEDGQVWMPGIYNDGFLFYLFSLRE